MSGDDDFVVPPPPMSPPSKWSDMDPKVRDRFHEMGNYLMVLHGVVVGLSMRVPRDPNMISSLQSRNEELWRRFDDMKADHVDGMRKLGEKVDQTAEKMERANERAADQLDKANRTTAERLDAANERTAGQIKETNDRLTALTLRVVGATTVLTALAQYLVAKL